MRHKGIIFDMDGTLWDSAENVAKSWNKAIADYGYERAPITKEDMYSVMGKTMDVLASIIFPNCTCRDELINVCYREENDYLTVHGGELYPDVEKTLDELEISSQTEDVCLVLLQQALHSRRPEPRLTRQQSGYSLIINT